MPEPKKTKGGGKDDGNPPKKPTPEELAKLAEEKPMSGLIPAMIEQDRLGGLPEDHQPYDEPGTEEDDRDSDLPGAEKDSQTDLSEDEPDEDDPPGEPVHGESSAKESDAEDNGTKPVLQKEKASSTAHKAIVRAINKEVATGMETTAERIGDLGLMTIGRGDARFALSAGLENSSLHRRVAQDPELMIKPQRLSEFIRFSAFKRILLEKNEDVSNLPPSKIIALLPVKDEGLRIQLAREANERNYSVRQIKNLVKGFMPRKVGEDLGKTIIKKIGTPLQMLNDDDLFTLCADRQLLMRDLSGAERRKILGQIREGKPRLKALDRLVETLETTLEEIEEE